MSKKRLCTPQPATARYHLLIIHAYIEVTDLDRGIEFYCGGLGLTLKRQLGPRWVELAGANLPIFLLADRSAMASLV
jgi:extradiol dioxygenase family protein